MKPRHYRVLIITAIVALAGLLCVQVYWFIKAYTIQENQFDVTVNLALRSVADKAMTLQGNRVKRIPPIQRRASNTYFVELKTPLRYDGLDSLIRTEFKKNEIYTAFELAVYSHKDDELLFNSFYQKGVRSNEGDSLLFGNFYKNGVLTEEGVSCLGRDHPQGPMDFLVTFPEKRADIVGAMNIWIFTAFTFLLILIVFGVMLIDLSKQKKLAEIKADFLNNMTHELQTPIANIAMASEVLRSASILDREKTARYANIIHDENGRLKIHMEHVLRIARMERGDMTIDRTEIDIHQVITEVIRNFDARIQKRGGKIVQQLHAASVMYKGDSFHLSNIFYNLLDNADKYSLENPEITITTENRGAGILISIADKGIGIRKDLQKFIFDKFYRAASGNQHDVKGFGLGLTYVHQIVTAHNGIVTVSSEENKGSRFDVFFRN